MRLPGNLQLAAHSEAAIVTAHSPLRGLARRDRLVPDYGAGLLGMWPVASTRSLFPKIVVDRPLWTRCILEVRISRTSAGNSSSRQTGWPCNVSGGRVFEGFRASGIVSSIRRFSARVDMLAGLMSLGIAAVLLGVYARKSGGSRDMDLTVKATNAMVAGAVTMLLSRKPRNH